MKKPSNKQDMNNALTLNRKVIIANTMEIAESVLSTNLN
jgi:hypothetical protein